MTEHEDQGEDREGLAGPGPKQAARRRYFFSHVPKVRDYYHKRATRHEREAKNRSIEFNPSLEKLEKSRQIGIRNEQKERAYYAELNHYQEQILERAEDRLRWADFREKVFNAGHIKSSTVGDYQDIPRSLRTTRGGIELDTITTILGYSYESDFENDTAKTYQKAKKWDSKKLEKPKRPKYEAEPRGKAFDRHRAHPEIKKLLNEYRELQTMLHQAKKELGSSDPTVLELAGIARETRDEYRIAATHAGIRPVV